MSDPTGTAALRRSFQAEGNRRLAQVRTQTHGILVEHDLMGASSDPLAQFFPHPGERLAMFSAWFENTVRQFLLGGNWWDRFLQRAYDSGTVAARKLTGSDQVGFMAVPSVFREMAAREFGGIAAVMVQQVSRQAGIAALGRRKPGLMYRQVLAVLKKIGQVRMKAAVNFMAIQLHNAARLAHYRAIGITSIGIDPELLEPPPPPRFPKRDHQHDHFVRDATRKEELEAAVREAEAALQEAQKNVTQAELDVAQAQARSEVATLRVQTAENEVSQVESEVAQAESRAQAIRSEDPSDPNYDARVAQAELMIERADAKLARAEVQAEDAQQAADDALAQVDEAKDVLAEARIEADTAFNDLREAQLALEGADATDLVKVLTAGDDKVCNVCLALAAQGPYELDEAETLLPAHPNCRCSWVPADDAEETSWWRRLLGAIGL